MFKECTFSFRPKLYTRYIDDVFAIFGDEQSYLDFFHFINSLHKNLEFTVEVASDYLPFLDVKVKLSEHDVELCVYRKDTTTNVILNFDAIAPDKWKSSLINCFLHRAWKVCTSNQLFDKEVDNLFKIFSENGYPAKFFLSCVS